MTEVTIFEDTNQRVVGFGANNHSGLAEAGNDIVCAGISTVFEVARAGLDDLPPDHVQQSRASDGAPDWRIVVSLNQLDESTVGEVTRLFTACRQTFNQIAETHPDYCTIETSRSTPAT